MMPLTQIFNEAIQTNALWESRQAAWDKRYPVKPDNYEKTLEMYRNLGSFIRNWVELPDISPADAIELGKTTPFSAEHWYLACTAPGHRIL